VRLHARVARVRAEDKRLELDSGEQLPFDHLVFATGAVPRSLKVPGEDLPGIFHLRNLTDALRIKNFLAEGKCKRALLVGAGFVSLEMCEAFRRLGLSTTLVHRAELPMGRLDEECGKKILAELEKNEVKFIPQATVENFESKSGGGILVETSNGPLETDLVLLGVGVLPEVSLAAKAGITLGPTGAIAVDDHMRTNLDFIYSAGDCCESYHRISGKPVHNPLGDIANKQGRVAGANIGGQNLIFPGIVGSNCFKVFDLEVASTGLTEREAKEAGFDATSVAIRGVSKPHGYPGAQKLWLGMVADKDSGRLLGAQGVGGDGVVSRINILAAVLTAGLSIQELAYLDLAYAPPFSGSWDPIHIAAQQLLK
jgi:NADPH-dependent 2,4-dienoyl-CoA reductase/sulfur reductase-like enzyme